MPWWGWAISLLVVALVLFVGAAFVRGQRQAAEQRDKYGQPLIERGMWVRDMFGIVYDEYEQYGDSYHEVLGRRWSDIRTRLDQIVYEVRGPLNPPETVSPLILGLHQIVVTDCEFLMSFIEAVEAEDYENVEEVVQAWHKFDSARSR